MSYFRPAIDALAAYQPGEQPAADAAVVKLNTNENPYPPSAAALAALRAVEPDSLRRYPQPAADEFRESAAGVLGVDPAWIVAGNGSDDLLTMLFRSVAGRRPAGGVSGADLQPLPHAGADAGCAGGGGAVRRLVRAARGPAGGGGGGADARGQPQQPLRQPHAERDLGELAARLQGVLVIDEAYAAFASGDALELTARHENVVVLRTLSKSHSLAGLRLGFAVARPALLAGLRKVKDSYNVDAVSARVGAAAIRDTGHTRANIERVRASRARLSAALAGVGCRVWPSEANFLLVRPPGGDARTVYEKLKAEGILIRYFDEPLLADRLRITVGTDEQNERLLDALRRLLTPGGAAGKTRDHR